MIKGVIAILALLNLVDANTLGQLSSKQGTKQHDDMNELQFDEGEDDQKSFVKSYKDQESQELEEFDATSELENNLRMGKEMLDLQLKYQAGYGTKNMEGCDYGIKRWTDPANSWKTFQDAHANKTKLFKDKSFPADSSMLFGKELKFVNKPWIMQFVKGLNYTKDWARPSQMQTEAPSLWGTAGKPIADGVKQGGLGDCWFMAAASAIAEVPDRMKRVIWNDEYDKNGAFRFYIWSTDRWHGTNIDDQLPSRKYTKWERKNNKWSRKTMYRPAFAQRSVNGAWWMPLLEKAYSKFNQNYQRIIGGVSVETLHSLTGMPSTMMYTKKMKEDEAYKLVSGLAKMNYPMTTSCCNSGGNYKGLVHIHAYTLLDIKELSNGVKLAKIRNPWSGGEWTGDWSDKSTKWTDALKKEAGHRDFKYDGSFFMPFNEWHQQFAGFSIALYQDYKGFQNLMIDQKERVMKYKINNPADQQMYVVGDTTANRNMPRVCNPNHRVALYLFDSNNKMLSKGFIGEFGFSLTGLLNEKLPKGDYTLQIVNEGFKLKPAKFALNTFWTDKLGNVEKI